MDIIESINKELMPATRNLDFEVGDTVKVHYKIVEGTRERIQIFEGIVIAINNKGISKTFTVRKISFDVGVERVFPLQSPRITKIEVIRKGKIRRAKLYYLRERKGKSAKLREKRGKVSQDESVQKDKATTKAEDSVQESVTAAESAVEETPAPAGE